MTERVIVVTHEASGQLLKVCASWEDYDAWQEQSDWEKYDVDTWDAAVYRNT